jgi:hypothetical protein
MNRKTLRVISGVTILAILVFLSNQSISTGQIKSGGGELYMSVGLIGKDSTLTGFFYKNSNHPKNQDWCVFIGSNGQVYKLFLTDKKVSSLYLDGQKIDDGQIGRHTAEYQPFLMKYLRNQEIENETEELEKEIKPLERKIEALDNEMSKLDEAEEKLERKTENSSVSLAEEKRNINAQQKKLAEMQREHEEELKTFSAQQEKLSDEQESLGLEKETDKVLHQIREDLKSLGVIKNLNNLSFKLSNLELIVNGKKPSSEIYEKLKAKYIFDFGEESGFLYYWKWKN